MKTEPRRAHLPLPLALAVIVAGAACGVEDAPGPDLEVEPRAAADEAVAPVGQGFHLNASDLRFIYQQIRISERHAGGEALRDVLPPFVGEPVLPYGLRTVDGSFNNLVPGREDYGAADRVFPRLVPAAFRAAESGTSYAQKKGIVVDSQPRLVSNLVVDQTFANPAAVAAAGPGAVPDASGTLLIPNVAPDLGFSPPFNSVFTLFGQFFDHGLDLVTKGGGTVFVPLLPGDPLFEPGSPTNFMVLTRATNLPGPDGVRGDDPATPGVDESLDDVQEATNTTTPFVDQNQTYTSHPSHQVFLREYVLDGGRPIATGRLLDGPRPGDLPSWGDVKAQAEALLGIRLADADVHDVPLLAADPYGRFLRGTRGFPMLTFPGGVLVEGDPAAPVSTAGALRTGHAFLDDIAHHAVPVGDHDRNPATPPQALAPDADPGTDDDGDPATYDDELLAAHFITGDGRVNENIGLTAVHVVFHSEHNRLVVNVHELVSALLTPAEIAAWQAVDPASGWDYGERLFQAARFVTEMEYQHLAFEEFARKVQPNVNAFTTYRTDIDPAVWAEFAHTVYRFGHSMLTETVARVNADGTPNDLSLLDAFLNPVSFHDGGPAGVLTAEAAAGSLFRGMARQVGNEIDEFVTEALRNRLLGLPLDLATVNLARGRSEGVPRLNDARRRFFELTGSTALLPYANWAELALSLRHEGSIVNFIAAYGTHPSIQGSAIDRRAAAERLVFGDPGDESVPDDAIDFMLGTGAWQDAGGRATTGLEDVDFWIGGLAEQRMDFGGLLGPTFNFVFETQLERLQDADRLYYLSRTAGLNLGVQLEGNTFAELIMRNTDVTDLPGDVFSFADYVFDLAAVGASGAILDDPRTAWNERTLLVRQRDGTVRYGGGAHVVFVGRDDPALLDRMWGGAGDDTFRGNGGPDVIEGGAGNDQLVGGDGDDVLTDLFGDDILRGGDGDDVLSSGPGFDINHGGRGNDAVIGGSDPSETFGGPGDDFVLMGESADTVLGDDGDDWIEGGGQADVLVGDSGAPFRDDPNAPGHDVLVGDGGDDDLVGEGGDDVFVQGPGIDLNDGMLGFDWAIHRGDPNPADAELGLSGFPPPDGQELRDRFDFVEALSGWRHDDVLRGDDRAALDLVGHELTPEGVARIEELDELLGGATSFTGGNILLGGAGSDVLQGGGGDDLVDGDAWLDVRIRAPNLATPDPDDFVLVDSLLALRADLLARRIHPGELEIVRMITTEGVSPADVDTAAFSGFRLEYTITLNDDGTVTVAHTSPSGIRNDGTDTLRNVERLAFLDGTIPAPTEAEGGTVTISSVTPVEETLLTVTAEIVDPDGVDPATLVFAWEVEVAPGAWTPLTSGASFLPDDPVVGKRLRVVATYFDLAPFPAQGTLVSAPTAPVTAVNDAPTGAPALSTATPRAGDAVSAVTSALADRDGLGAFTFAWRLDGAPIPGATAPSFTPAAAHAGQALSVSVSWLDGQGFTETVTSASAVVAPAPDGPVAAVAPAFSFGARRVGSSVAGVIDVVNTGTAPLHVATAAVTGAAFPGASLGTCAVPLAPGKTCRVSVTFRPITAGAHAGTLTVTSDATNGPVVVALAGTAR